MICLKILTFLYNGNELSQSFLHPLFTFLKNLVFLCEKYSETFNLESNTNKSIGMSFTSKTTNIDNISIFLNRKKLKNVDS